MCLFKRVVSKGVRPPDSSDEGLGTKALVDLDHSRHEPQILLEHLNLALIIVEEPQPQPGYGGELALEVANLMGPGELGPC